MGKPYVPCFCCKGLGIVEVPSEYLRTLRVVERKGEVTPAEVARATGVTHTATCNRLEQLRDWGFVSRWKEGRHWIYIPLGSKPTKESPDGK